MVVRVLFVVAAFAILYGCGKPSPPPEEVQKGEGIELLSKQSKPMRPGISAQVLDDLLQRMAPASAKCAHSPVARRNAVVAAPERDGAAKADN